jgi:hypothetical protein
MNERRRVLQGSLKTISVPLLREMGFKGSFPHFHRAVGDHIDLLMFQFRLDGSSFIVEISYADPERTNLYFRPETPVARLRVRSTKKRYRLGESQETSGDGTWFELNHGLLTTQARYFNKIALRVNDLIFREAVPWWEAQRHGVSL